MRIAIINGPNLNLLGKREPHIYGTMSFEDYFNNLCDLFVGTELVYYQSNHEGSLIDYVQHEGFKAEGIIINAGGYSHTSIALRDAIAAVSAPAVEVHISNIIAREEFRHHSFLTDVCKASIIGKGLDGYKQAIELLLNYEK